MKIFLNYLHKIITNSNIPRNYDYPPIFFSYANYEIFRYQINSLQSKIFDEVSSSEKLLKK